MPSRATRAAMLPALTPPVLSLPALVVLGLGAALVIVAAGGAVGPVPGTRLPTDWLGLLRPQPVNPVSDPWPGLLLLFGVLALVLTWLAAVRSVRRAELSWRGVAALSAAWSAPLALGPPLLSNDVFSYAAQGLMWLRGLDPYRAGPASLGATAAAAAVDPRWRAAPSPYGPLAGYLERLATAVAGGNLVATVVVLRLVAVLALLLIGALAYRLAAPQLRASALVLTVANPLLLLQGVSAAHFEVLMGALVLAALLAAARARPGTSVVLACAAGAVKFPALVVGLAVAVAFSVRPVGGGADRRDRSPARRLVGYAALMTGAWLLLARLVTDGWGWLAALGTPGRVHTPLAVTQVVAGALGWPLRLAGIASPAAVTTGVRLLGVLVAAAVCLWLVATAAARPLAVTTGLALLVCGLLAPVLYPWYLLWGALVLATVADGEPRSWLVGLCAVGIMLSLPGMARATIATVGISIGLLALAAVARGAYLLWARSRRGHGAELDAELVVELDGAPGRVSARGSG